jgi:hypothetical protein
MDLAFGNIWPRLSTAVAIFRFNPEGDNCNVCENIGKPSTFYMAYSQKSTS